MSVVHGRRPSGDHVSRDTTTSSDVGSVGGRPARFPSTHSTLSAAAAPFAMVPSAVRVHSAHVAVRDAAAPSVGDDGAARREKARARRQRKPRAKGSGSAGGHDDELEDKAAAPTPAPAAEQNGKAVAKKKKKKPAADKPKQPASAPTSDEAKPAAKEEEDDGTEYCLLCADPIQFYAIGECNHLGICSRCSMKMRMIMKDRNCPMCKAPLERVIVSSEPREFDSFELWGDAAGWDSVLDEPSDMIYYSCKPHYEAMRKLREFACRVKKCREVLHSLGALKEHLRHAHGAEFCELCLQHQTFFIQEQQVFTKNSIKAHNVGKNRANGPKQSTGNKDFHPVCQFCKKRFYGDLELYNHLERDHFKCHICKIEHEYYRN